MSDNTMAMQELVSRVRSLNHKFQGQRTVADCSRIVLCDTFGVEPTREEIEELVSAVRDAELHTDGFLEEWDFETEASQKGVQYGRGKEIVHKSEHRAG